MNGFLPIYYKIIKFLGITFCVCVFHGFLYGQENPTSSNRGHIEIDSTEEHHHDSAVATDSLDSVRMRKPIIYSWRYDEGSFVERKQLVDTLIDGFQRYLPAEHSDVFSITAGGIARPSMSTSAYHQTRATSFVPVGAFSSYFFSQNNAVYYNTKKAFSQMTYVQGSFDEQLLNAWLTVNVNRFWNVGVHLYFTTEKGAKERESMGSKQIRVFSSYRGARYFALFNLSFNRFTGYETGGLSKDSLLGNNLSRYSLAGPISKTNYTSLYIRHELNLLKPVRLLDSATNRFDEYRLSAGITQQFESSDRRYDDAFTSAGDTSYYRSFGLSSPLYKSAKATTASLLQIHDSLQQIILRNEGFFRFTLPVGERNRITLVPAVGLENERNHYMSNRVLTFPSDYQSIYAQGFGSIKVHSVELNATLTQWMAGHKSGDFKGLGNLNYAISLPKDTIVLRATGLFESARQSYFVESMNLSHLQWNTSFKNTQRSEIRGFIGLADGRAGVGALSSLVNNYVYFNDKAMPMQDAAVIATMAIYLQKKTRFWHFVLENEIVLQQSSKQSVMPLPRYTMYNVLYYSGRFFQKKLGAQFGVDANYYESYYAPGYFPLSGVFYVQNTSKYGNYPFVNVFCNLQFKRVKLLLKYNNVLYYTGDNRYFTLAHYASKAPGVIFGVSWHFHN